MNKLSDISGAMKASDASLKIKTYLEEPAISVAQETLAGPMTFTIWPITEDLVDVTPGIGVTMTKQAEELRKTRTSIDTGGN